MNGSSIPKVVYNLFAVFNLSLSFLGFWFQFFGFVWFLGLGFFWRGFSFRLFYCTLDHQTLPPQMKAFVKGEEIFAYITLFAFTIKSVIELFLSK